MLIIFQTRKGQLTNFHQQLLKLYTSLEYETYIKGFVFKAALRLYWFFSKWQYILWEINYQKLLCWLF